MTAQQQDLMTALYRAIAEVARKHRVTFEEACWLVAKSERELYGQ